MRHPDFSSYALSDFFLSSDDLVYSQSRVVLTMPLAPSVTLARTVFPNENLLAAKLLDDSCLYRSAIYGRLADARADTIRDEQHII
jgi:hypothetical protein